MEELLSAYTPHISVVHNIRVVFALLEEALEKVFQVLREAIFQNGIPYTLHQAMLCAGSSH